MALHCKKCGGIIPVIMINSSNWNDCRYHMGKKNKSPNRFIVKFLNKMLESGIVTESEMAFTLGDMDTVTRIYRMLVKMGYPIYKRCLGNQYDHKLTIFYFWIPYDSINKERYIATKSKRSDI